MDEQRDSFGVRSDGYDIQENPPKPDPYDRGIRAGFELLAGGSERGKLSPVAILRLRLQRKRSGAGPVLPRAAAGCPFRRSSRAISGVYRIENRALQLLARGSARGQVLASRTAPM